MKRRNFITSVGATGSALLVSASQVTQASEAIDMGLADTMAAPVKMAARFDVSGFRNAPEAIVVAMKAKDDPTAVEPDPEPANGSNADPEPDRAAIRTEAMAYAKTVVDLCRLAGQPQMAAGFLEAEISLEDIRKALIDARAAADPDISAAHPQPGPAPQAKPWGDVINRTFKRKG